jgi:hypothetical protein
MARLCSTFRMSVSSGLLIFAVLFILRIITNKYSGDEILCPLTSNKLAYTIAVFLQM